MTNVDDVVSALHRYDDSVARLVISQSELIGVDKTLALEQLSIVKKKNLVLKAYENEIGSAAVLVGAKQEEVTASLAAAFAAAKEEKGVKGVSQAKIEEALRIGGLSSEKAKEIAQRYANANAAEKEAASIKKTDLAWEAGKNMVKAIGGFIKAHPALTAIGAIVTVLGLSFKKAQKDIENAASAVEEATDNWDQLHSTLLSNQQSVASIKDEYAKLAEGVGSGGENISLTTDEFERYNSIANQIADMFPELIAGYTEQGNAILTCRNNVELLNKSLEAQEELYHSTILGDAGAIFEKWNGTWFSNTFKFSDTMQGQAEQLEYYKKVLDAASSYGVDALAEVFASSRLSESKIGGRRERDLLKEVLGDDYTRMLAHSDMGVLSAEEKHLIQQKVKAYVTQLDASFAEDEEAIKNIMRSYLTLEADQRGMSDEAKSAVQQMISGIDYSFIYDNNFTSAEQVYEWIDKTFIDPLTDPSTRQEFTNAMNFFLGQGIDVSKLSANMFTGGRVDFSEALEKLKRNISSDNTDLMQMYGRDEDVRGLIDALVDLGYIHTVTEDAIYSVGNAYIQMGENATEATDKAVDGIGSMTEALDSIVEKYDFVKSAQEEFAESGQISSKTLSSIVENFSGMEENVALYIAGLKTSKELLSDLSDAYKVDEQNYYSTIKAKLEVSTDFCNSLTDDQRELINKMAESYDLDLKNFTTIENAKLDIQAQIVEKLAKNYKRYANATLAELKAEYSRVESSLYGDMGEIDKGELKRLAALEEAIAEIEGAYSELDKIVYGNLTSSWNPKKFSNDVASSAKDAAEEAEDAFEKLKEQLEDWFSDMEFQVEIKFNAGDIEGASELYQQMIDKARDALDDAFEMGLTIDDDWVQNLMSKISDYKKSLADLRLEELDKFIEIHDSFDGWDDLDLSKLDTLKKKLAEINKLYEEGLLNYQDYYDLYMDTAGEIYSTQRDALETLLEEVQSALEKSYEDQIDGIEEVRDAQVEALEDEAELLDKIISKRKKLLEDARDEANHEREVADLVAKAAKLRERITQLDLDDSREANAEKVALQEELDEVLRNLSDLQADYATDKALEALDAQGEAFQDATDDKIDSVEDAADEQIKILEDQLDDEVALRREAIELINRDYQTMMNDIMGYFESLGYQLDESLLEPLRQGLDLVAQYGDYNSAGTGITSDATDGLLPTQSISNLVSKMKQNASAWHTVSTEDERRDLADKNENIAQQLRDQFGLNVWKESDGVWYVKIDGKKKKLFEQWHTGGTAGSVSTPKSNEIFALLEKGEVILNDGQQNSFLNIMKTATAWMNDMMSMSFGSIAGKMKNLSPAVTHSTGIGTYSPNIEVNIHHNGSMTDADAKRYGKEIGKTALDELYTALQKRGIT